MTTQNSILHLPKVIKLSSNHAVQTDNKRNNQKSQNGINRIFSGILSLPVQQLNDNESAQIPKVHIRKLTPPPILSQLRKKPDPVYDDMDPFPDEYESPQTDSEDDTTPFEYNEYTVNNYEIDEAPPLPTKKKVRNPKGKKKITGSAEFPTWFIPSETTGTIGNFKKSCVS